MRRTSINTSDGSNYDPFTMYNYLLQGYRIKSLSLLIIWAVPQD